MPDIPTRIQLDTDAVVAKVMKTVHAETAAAVRAAVAEEIAQAIEAEQVKCYPGSPRDKVYAAAAAIARNHTLAGQDPADKLRDPAPPPSPGQPTQERPLS